MFFFIFLCSFLFIGSSSAAEYRIAVLEFRGIDQDNPALLNGLSDEVRRASLDVFPPGISIFSILTRENILEVLQKEGRSTECLSETCEITLGRNMGADFIILGVLSEVEGYLRLTVSIFDTKKNTLLGKKTFQANTKSQLIENVYQGGKQLIDSKLGKYDQGRTGRKIIPPKPDRWSVSKIQKGILYFSNTSTLRAKVFMDGKEICATTPCSTYVEHGQHNITMRYPNCDTWKDSITFEKPSENISAPMSCHFTNITGTSINGQPIYLDDTALSTNVRQEFANGTYKLSIPENDCYESFGDTVQLNGGSVRLPINQKKKTVTITVRGLKKGDKGKVSGVNIIRETVTDTTYSAEVHACAKNIKVYAESDDNRKEFSTIIDKIIRDKNINVMFKQKEIGLTFFNSPNVSLSLFSYSYVFPFHSKSGSASRGSQINIIDGQFSISPYVPAIPNIRYSVASITRESESYSARQYLSILPIGLGYHLNLFDGVALTPYTQLSWNHYISDCSGFSAQSCDQIYVYPSKIEFGTEILFNYMNRSSDWLDGYGDLVLGVFTENRTTMFEPYTNNTSGSRFFSLRGGISHDLVFGQTNVYLGAGLLFTGSAWGENPIEGLGDAFWSNTRLVGYTATAAGVVLGSIIIVAASDRRVKEAIEKMGVSPSGINIYRFQYKGRPETFVGVMAQELLQTHPHAVFTMPNGLYAVAYDMIDVSFSRLD